MQQIIGLGRQRVGRTPPRPQMTQEASNGRNGVIVIVEQLKGFILVTALGDMVDSQ